MGTRAQSLQEWEFGSQHQISHQDFPSGREARSSSNIWSKGSVQHKGWTGEAMGVHYSDLPSREPAAMSVVNCPCWSLCPGCTQPVTEHGEGPRHSPFLADAGLILWATFTPGLTNFLRAVLQFLRLSHPVFLPPLLSQVLDQRHSWKPLPAHSNPLSL